MDYLVNTTTAILLHLLQHQQVYGLGFIEGIKAETNGLVSINQGALYPTLRRLLNEGHLEQSAVRAAGGGRARNYYTLTHSGRRLAESHKRALTGLLHGFEIDSS